MLIFEKKYVIMNYDEKARCVVQTWFGYSSGNEFREAIDFTMNFLDKNGLYRILSDIREQTSVSADDQRYVTEKIEDFANRNGSFKMAFIMPKSILAEISVQYFVKDSETRLGKNATRFFDSIESAAAWLAAE